MSDQEIAMKQWLPIGEAAQYLGGLSVDTVRRLANEGTLKAKRTPGGHRRFHVAVLDAYRKGTGQRSRSQPGRTASLKPKRVQAQPVDPFVELGGDLDEWTEFDANDPDEWTDFEQPTTPIAMPAVRNVAMPAEPARIDSITPVSSRPRTGDQNPSPDETLRLQTIRNWGLVAIPAGTPPLWWAKVTQDLERNVTTENFPVGLPLNDAIELVRGRVSAVLEPYEREKALEGQRVEDERRRAADEKEEAEEQRQIRKLVAHAEHYAWRETMSWDREDRKDAREEVSEVLGARVGADWSEDNVEELVDDILDKYDDDE